MKIAILLAAASATATTATASATISNNSQPYEILQEHSGANAASLYLPPGATLREVFRLYNARHERHATLFYFPQNWNEFGWRRENTFGFISGTPFENSRPLYMCGLMGVSHAFFTSPDVKCEGHFLTSFGMVGYISTIPLPDTAPFYRCHYMFKGRLTHFDTTLANCGNIPTAVNDGVLGYVFL